MILFAAALLLLLLQSPAPAQQVSPVLQFPEAGVDDPARFEGYQTRFFRDAAGNTLQIYLNQRDGRVVHVWGNAANESLGLSVRDAAGRPPALAWAGDSAVVDDRDGRRSVEYRLRLDAPGVEIGHFMLGTMRVERDFQHFEGHRQPWNAPPFERPELTALIGNLQRLDAAERRRHLDLLRARTVGELRARMRPQLAQDRRGGQAGVRIEHHSFDGRNLLALELRTDPRQAELRLANGVVSARSRGNGPIDLVVRVSTDADPLTPIRYREMFNERFLGYLDARRAERDRVRALPAAQRGGAEQALLMDVHRMERMVWSLELLSSREKLMAGLPNYGTYFGRDMLMSALMMEPVWTDRMAESVIGSVLGKLAPTGQVSHEEALGGQAIRERAAIYNQAMEEHFAHRQRGDRAAADASLQRARDELGRLQRVRENYHMRDDDFQFPVYVARYLVNPSIPAEQKRAFLTAAVPEQDGATRLDLLLRNLAFVARESEAYGREPVPLNLVDFPPRTETAWYPASWRDSNIGYANGRFAMDVNVVWVPAALRAIGQMAPVLRQMGFGADQLEEASPAIRGTTLATYLRDAEALRRAEQAWNGAARHFMVELAPVQVRERVGAWLAALPDEEERRYWSAVFERNAPDRPLRFLALSLDAEGRAIPVVNTDVAMRFYIERLRERGDGGTLPAAEVLDDVHAVMLPYPVGLYIPAIGPVVANDAYASPAVWEGFRADHYHSPRVVWGREVNLMLLGLARQIDDATDAAGNPLRPELVTYVTTLRDALHRTREAVEASGLIDQELWSYRIADGRLYPHRYAASTDLQLWNLTALRVQYELERMAGVGAAPGR
jgi:hypothetical protein